MDRDREDLTRHMVVNHAGWQLSVIDHQRKLVAGIRVRSVGQQGRRPCGIDCRGVCTKGAADERDGRRAPRSGPVDAREDAEGRLPDRQLAELGRTHGLPKLSMGMSHDLEAAIEEGATMVRVGSAIFGQRPAAQAR